MKKVRVPKSVLLFLFEISFYIYLCWMSIDVSRDLHIYGFDFVSIAFPSFMAGLIFYGALDDVFIWLSNKHIGLVTTDQKEA